MMVIMLVMSFFSKNKNYDFLFTSALKEGLNDWCKEMGYSKEKKKAAEILNKTEQEMF
jgi:hypothetical protein